MLKDKLSKYAQVTGHKFKVHYTLDQPGLSWEEAMGHVTKGLLRERMPQPSSNSKVLLCGPPGMVNAMKNISVELGFDSPGAVSKDERSDFLFLGGLMSCSARVKSYA